MGTAAGIAAAVGAAASVASAANAIASDGSGGSTVQSQSGPPAWLQQYYQQAAGLAGDVGKTPLRQYQGPMVAGFSPMQLEAMQGVQNAQGIANPYINTASQYASSAGQPIGVPGQLSGGQLAGLYGQGLGYSDAAANTNIRKNGKQGIGEAYAGVGVGANEANRAIGNVGQAVNMGSGANYGRNVQQYMSPYTQDVVNATQAQFNNQNAQQQQGVVGNAISSGAWGGDRASVAQGITAGQQSLAQAPVIAGLYNQGFQNAQQQLNTQQQVGMQGAQAEGQLGLSAGQLRANTGLQAGQMGQSAAAQQAALRQQAAQQYLGLFQGQQQQGIGAQEASGWLGANSANIYGALGQQAQSGALTDASALWGMGQQQQGLHQQQLNIPYEQFQQQQAYPFQVAGWQANILEGLGSGAGGTSSTTYPGPSGIGQALGGLTSAAGYLGQTGIFGGGLNQPDFSGMGSIPYQTVQGGLTAVNPAPDIPTYSARGGRIARAEGGRPGIPNGPFGMFAAPMKRAFAATGGPTGGQGGQAHLELSAPSHFVGMRDGSRGISHPMLSMPTNARMPTDSTYNIPQMAQDYTPPAVGSAKYTSTYFPSLNGQSGDPTSKTIAPVNFKGQWMTPDQKAASVTADAKPTFYSGPINNVKQAYEELLHREPDPGGLAYYSVRPLSDAIAGIKASQEYFGVQNASSLNPPPPTPTYATGGLARRPLDSGGATSGASSAGLAIPVGGGSPVAQGTLANLRGMPPEKLQELSVRFPASSQYGSMIRRALQLVRNAPQDDQSGGMAAGGRMRFAGGGDPGGGLSDLNEMSGGPDSALDYAPEAIFDDAGLTQNLVGKGIVTPASDTDSVVGLSAPPSHERRSTVPAAPSGGPGVPAAPAPAGIGLAKPPSAADLPPPRADGRAPAVDPWRQLIAMGSGMMASTSPFAGVAIGQGLEAGLKEGDRQQQEADRQRQADNEDLWKNKDIELRVKDMDQRLDQFKQTHDLATKSEADRVQHEQDMEQNDLKRLAIESTNSGYAAENAAAHAKEADRGDYQATRPLLDENGKPKLDANGLPLAVYTDKYDPSRQKIAPLPDQTIAGGRQSGTMALVNKMIGEGKATDTVDALAKIHDPSGHYAATNGLRMRDEAIRAATLDPAFQGDPEGTVDKWLGKLASDPKAGGAAPATAATAPAVPPPAERKAGQVYPTPKGPLQWTGTGWITPPSGN